MTEVMTLHREMNGEEGEQCCVRYTLTAELCGRVQLYGVRCCVEGLPPQAERCKQIPAWLEDRRVGELLLEYLAEREVTPTELEDILYELLP